MATSEEYQAVVDNLSTSKEDLKQAINAKGGSITDESLSTFANQVANLPSGSDAQSIQGVDVSETAPTTGQIMQFNGTQINWVELSALLKNAVVVGQTTITTTNGAKNFVQTVGTMYSGRKFIAMAMWQSYSSIDNPFAASLLGAGTVTAQGKITLTNLYGVTVGTFNLVYAIF